MAREKMITPVVASELLGVSIKTLASWRSKSIGPTYYKRSNHVYYKESELQTFMKNRYRKYPTDEDGVV